MQSIMLQPDYLSFSNKCQKASCCAVAACNIEGTLLAKACWHSSVRLEDSMRLGSQCSEETHALQDMMGSTELQLLQHTLDHPFIIW